jgi:peptide/nickel transport system substrate-binding protein
MERAAAFGITAACANTLLSQAGVAATPKRGGSARFGLSHGATTDTGNPATYSDS